MKKIIDKNEEITEYYEKDICYLKNQCKEEDCDSPHSIAKRNRDIKNENRLSIVVQ